MTTLTRRKFLTTAAVAATSFSISTSLTGCAARLNDSQLSSVAFNHGVASGDPLSTAVIIWSRATGIDIEDHRPVNVAWELAKDRGFKKILRSGFVSTNKAVDYTIKVDVQDLEPNTEYFYRFVGANGLSPVGRTKTLPVGSVDQIKLAVFSCSNYPAGFFNAYHDAAKQTDLDAVLHLGDYIYEYGMGGYATDHAEEIGRALHTDNDKELLSLMDYRKRYATYRTDEGLQNLHAAAPFIVVWDDHEVSNDTWKNGAQNHNKGEGDFAVRKANAIQAYYEWLPIRPPMGEHNPQIYRSFDFGDLMTLHMLDTRVVGRDEQLAYANYRDKENGEFDQAKFVKDISAGNRTLLGQTQFDWLASQLQKSNAVWQMLGQQVLMGKMHMPAEIFGSPQRNKIPAIIKQLVEIKQQVLQGKSVSDEQMKRLKAVTPYNLDAWDGYPVERERLFQTVQKLNKNLVVVAGDTHNAWCNELKNNAEQTVGIEFATPGVSSPGMEKYLKLDSSQAKQLAEGLTTLIDGLVYCDMSQRGYMTVVIDKQKIDTTWVFIDNILSKNYQVAETYHLTHHI